MWPTRRPVSRAEGLNLKRVEALGLPCWDEANTKSLYGAEKKEIRAIGSRAGEILLIVGAVASSIWAR
jgi:hypothetical protein